MKKFLALILAAVMIAITLPLTVGAQSQPLNGTGWDPDVVVNVKKADPENVKKDGVIRTDEYEWFNVDLWEESSPLHVTFITGDDMNNGLDMLATMEYYFSWDEVHGINIAIRNKPAEISQLLDVKEGDTPEDDFCQNVAWGISAQTDNDDNPNLYFALGKRTDDGRYLEGHWNQLGAQGDYDPVELEDYVIDYDYETGYCTIEWSIPLDVFLKAGGGAGSQLQFTLWATGGTNTVPDFSTAYGVVLGDFGFMVNQKNMHNHVTYNLTDEVLEEPTPVFGPIFEDVPDDAYFKAPVDWAVSKGITTGTSATTFSPNDGCTRGQVVAFLWRAAGSPEPKENKNPFGDVKSNAYYYKAVLWAVENEVTSGTDATHFSPNSVCTRGQIVTFLWRANGKPAPSKTANPFKDVKASDYYYDAVLWAVEKDITLGTDAAHFSPSSTCTRGQVVAFLYRAMAQ